MSIEPTCIFCNASDKSRCRTQGQANKCDAYQRQKKLRVSTEAKGGTVRGGGGIVGTDPDKISVRFGADLSAGMQVSIASHSGGVPNRYTLNLKQDHRDDAKFVLTQYDLDHLIKVLLQMQDYMKPQKGTR